MKFSGDLDTVTAAPSCGNIVFTQLPRSTCTLQSPSPSHPWAEPLVLPIVLLEFEHTCAKMCASVTLII